MLGGYSVAVLMSFEMTYYNLRINVSAQDQTLARVAVACKSILILFRALEPQKEARGTKHERCVGTLRYYTS